MKSNPDVIGYLGAGISLIGAIGAFVFEQPAIAAIPVAIGVSCNVVSRNQLAANLIESHNENQEAINKLQTIVEGNQNDLTSNINMNQANLSEQIRILKNESTTNFDNLKLEFNHHLENLKIQQDKLTDIVSNLREVESFSQELRAKPDSAEFYYQRGMSHENLGNKQGALEDYNEAIKQNNDFAPAYHKRGVIHLDLGEKQEAVDDLRKAALLYFEQGDIESYQKARDMSRKIHDLRSNLNLNGSSAETVVGTQLFA